MSNSRKSHPFLTVLIQNNKPRFLCVGMYFSKLKLLCNFSILTGTSTRTNGYRDSMLTLANVPALDSHICASNAKTYTMRIHDTKRDFPLSCAASLTRKKSQKTLDNVRQSVQRGLSQQQMLPASHHKINITRSSSWHGKNSSASPETQVNWQQQKKTSVDSVFAPGLPRKSLYHRQRDIDFMTANQTSNIVLPAASHNACATARPAQIEEETGCTQKKKGRVRRFIAILLRYIYS